MAPSGYPYVLSSRMEDVDMCAMVRLDNRLLSSPRELRGVTGILVWHEDYSVCATHDVWLDSCLCSIDIPSTLEGAGLHGNWAIEDRGNESSLLSTQSGGGS